MDGIWHNVVPEDTANITALKFSVDPRVGLILTRLPKKIMKGFSHLILSIQMVRVINISQIIYILQVIK